MLLKEIYNTTVIQDKIRGEWDDSEDAAVVRHEDDNFDTALPSDPLADPEKLGNGSSARVKKLNPHEVHKQSRMAIEARDPFWDYVVAINDAEHFPERKGNPYFPRVTFAHDTTDSAGSGKQTYHMERLFAITQLNIEQIIACMRVAFDEAIVNHVEQKILSKVPYATSIADIKPSEYNQAMSTAAYAINDMLRYALNNLDYEYIADENLQQALALISNIKLSNRHYFYDIHTGNVYYRITPHGVQLVLMDPLASSRSLDELKRKSHIR